MQKRSEGSKTSSQPLKKRSLGASFLLSLFDLFQRFLGELHIVQRQLARADQVSHYWPRLAAKDRQQLIDQRALRRLARDHRRKDVEVTDLPQPLYRFLLFHAIDHLLDRRIPRPLLLRKRLLHLANRSFILCPERFHDLDLKLRKPYRSHI